MATVNSLINYTDNIMCYDILSALRGKPLISGSETNSILSILSSVGSKLGNVVYPDINAQKPEWLYDMVWRGEQKNNQTDLILLESIPLVLESEFGDVDDVMYDFQKLLLANAYNKVMIFKAEDDRLRTIDILITEQVNLYPMQVGGTILCIAYNNSFSNFQYKIFKKSNNDNNDNKYILCIGQNCKNWMDKSNRESIFRHANYVANYSVPYAAVSEGETGSLKDAVERGFQIIIYVLDGPVIAEQNIINQELANYAFSKGYHLIGFDGDNLILNYYDVKSKLCCINEGLLYLTGLKDDLDKLMMGLSGSYKE